MSLINISAYPGAYKTKLSASIFSKRDSHFEPAGLVGGSLYRSPLPVPKMKNITFTLPALSRNQSYPAVFIPKRTLFHACIDWVKLYSYRSYDKAF